MNKFLNLIKRGGGTGPVKPGNQHSNVRWCQFLRDIFLADEVALYMKASSAYVYEGAFSLEKSPHYVRCAMWAYTSDTVYSI